MKRTAVFAFLVALACDALAAEGALEINQACVSVGCFSGDGPGLPVAISQPGTYVMTSNLLIGAAETAITVSASNVTIEMQGFRIVGPASCTLAAASTCAARKRHRTRHRRRDRGRAAQSHSTQRHDHRHRISSRTTCPCSACSTMPY